MPNGPAAPIARASDYRRMDVAILVLIGLLFCLSALAGWSANPEPPEPAAPMGCANSPKDSTEEIRHDG